MSRLPLIDSREEEIEIMQRHIRGLLVPGRQLQILEAGCGHAWPLDLTGVDYVLTGLDLDQDALEIRLNDNRDLHKGIVGDLRTAELDAQGFDVIYSSFVLEHVDGAEMVLHNFRKWLKPGGIILLRIPDPQSVYGYITRATPHWFHVFYYRHVMRMRMAGRAGFGPYQVYYDRVLWRKNLSEFCDRNGLEMLAEYGDGYIRHGKGIVSAAIGAFKQAVGYLSLGRLSHRHTNLLFILQKKG